MAGIPGAQILVTRFVISDVRQYGDSDTEFNLRLADIGISRTEHNVRFEVK